MPAYDAFLLLSFGGPEGPDDVLPFLENVTRGRGVPAERLAEVAEHYHAVRRRQPDQRPVPRDARRDRRRVRAEPASTCRCTGGTGTGTRSSRTPSARCEADGVRARDRVRHLRLQLLLRLPPVPGRHRPGGRRRRARARRGSTRSARTSTTRASSSRSRPASRRPWPGCPPRPRPAPGWSSPRTASRGHGRRQRQPVGGHRAPRRAGRPVRGRVARGLPAYHRTGAWLFLPLPPLPTLPSLLPFDLVFQSRSGPPSVPWLEPDVNDHLAALAKGTLAGRRRRCPRACRRRSSSCPSGSSATTWRSCTTWTWRRRGRRRRSACRSRGPRRPGRPPGSPRWSRELVAERISGAPAAGPRRPRPWRLRGRSGRLPRRLLPVRPRARAGHEGPAFRDGRPRAGQIPCGEAA